MAWYRAGSVAVTNGSAVVTGTGTDFVSNTQQGEAFLGPDGRIYEVGQVISATQLTLAGNYQGASAGGQGFALMPTSSFARDLALGAAQLLNTFAVVRDGIGAGLFPDGSAAAPGMRFSADQDTGIRRTGDNMLAIVTGGVNRMTISATGAAAGPQLSLGGGTAANVVMASNTANWSAGVPDGANRYRITENQFGSEKLSILSSGNVGIGVVTPRGKLELYRSDAAVSNLTLSSSFAPSSYVELNAGVNGVSNGGFDLRLGGTSRLIVDDTGSLLVGISSGPVHTIARSTATEGQSVFNLDRCGLFYVSSGALGSSAATTMNLLRNTSTGRSINTGGTINASGADYAEYMRKADGCGAIAKGDVCGVDIDGFLTRTWAAAKSYVVKSTDPSLVGGDVWAGHLPDKPTEPRREPIAPGDAPAVPGPAPERPASDATESDLAHYDMQAAAYAGQVAEWKQATAYYADQVEKYPDDHAAWIAEQAAYEAALAAWEDELETARRCVDRIAFCGQVPVNVAGAFAVGDYIIAAANGAGIQAIAIAEADITFDQYRRRIGKVWAVRDGRAWVDVQHG